MTLGRRSTVGHQAMLHGCNVDDNSLTGTNAVVLNGAKIGSHYVIGSNALVTENMGIPAKIKENMILDQQKALEQQARHYVKNGRSFKQGLLRTIEVKREENYGTFRCRPLQRCIG